MWRFSAVLLAGVAWASTASGGQFPPAESVSDAMARTLERREERSVWIEVPEISQAEARRRLGEPGVVFIDVTCPERRKNLTHQIPGAVWRECTRVEEWSGAFDRDQALIVYCA